MRLWIAAVLVLLLGLSGPVSLHAEDHGPDHATLADEDHGFILAFVQDEGIHIEHDGLHHDHATHPMSGHAGEDEEAHHSAHLHIAHDHASMVPGLPQAKAPAETGITYRLIDESEAEGAPAAFLKPPTFLL